jgi:hypothetical protein
MDTGALNNLIATFLRYIIPACKIIMIFLRYLWDINFDSIVDEVVIT